MSGSENPSTTDEIAAIRALTGAVAGAILMFAVGFFVQSARQRLKLFCRSALFAVWRFCSKRERVRFSARSPWSASHEGFSDDYVCLSDRCVRHRILV